jgi:hypothetical protein
MPDANVDVAVLGGAGRIGLPNPLAPAIRAIDGARRAADWPWNLFLPVVFVLGSAVALLNLILVPGLLGWHAPIYTDATRAWLTGADPWQVGPRDLVFAGPPPMLALFLPFVSLPDRLIAMISLVGCAAVAVAMLRRLHLPAYWIAFPPLFQAVVLGHPEVPLAALLLFGGALGGLSTIVKPYMAFVLVAERRWRALAVALVVFVVTLPLLPWSTFIAELPMITQNLARQARGDSVFGDPLLMTIGAVALLALGPRRGLWLATPLMWPYAQPLYKVSTVPALSPIVAAFWALPIPGLTLAGVVIQAVAVQIGRRRPLPAWLAAGTSDVVPGGTSLTASAKAGAPA